MSNFQTTLEQLKEVILLLETYPEIPENQKDIFGNLIKDKLANAYGQLLIINGAVVSSITQNNIPKVSEEEMKRVEKQSTEKTLSNQQEEFRISKVHRMQKLKSQLKENNDHIPASDSKTIINIQETTEEVKSFVEEEKIQSPIPINWMDMDTIIVDENITSSLNQKFSKNADKVNLADKLKGNKISDLKSSIGLNQRIAFTKSLFGGDAKAFNEFINILDKCNGLIQANEVVQNHVLKLEWDTSKKVYDDLQSLVNKRFD
jgi:hypothetical protein